MSQSSQKIGQMDPCYFLGRREILDWINAVCQLNLSKVEQTCTGAIACQLLDAIYPGKIQMSKVDWTAKDQYQYVNNYKVLQNAFTKLNIDKPIAVDRLIRGRYQDNLEFMQWFKAFYDLNCGEREYDALTRRHRGKGGQEYTNKFKATTTGAVVRPVVVRSASSQRARTVPSGHARSTTPAPAEAKLTKEQEELISQHENTIAKMRNETDELGAQNNELRDSVDGLEKERDFYFKKLRDVEILIQNMGDENNAASELAQKVLKILYATDDDADADAEYAEEQEDQNKTNATISVPEPEEQNQTVEGQMEQLNVS